MVSRVTELGGVVADAAGGGLVPRGTRVEVFQRIYWVFLALGTLVGIVVIGYMVYNAYKYREGGAGEDAEVERPSLGELPTGGGGGRKLFLSLTLSAIIVVSLIAWTYFTLLYVEEVSANSQQAQQEALDAQNPMVVEVTGYQWYWEFSYPNGHTTDGPFRIPVDRQVVLRVTSADVMHNLGIPGLRAKTDAIPGQYTNTWLTAEEKGTYEAVCYELCGVGHSYMTADVVVMEQSEFESWYANTTETSQ